MCAKDLSRKGEIMTLSLDQNPYYGNERDSEFITPMKINTSHIFSKNTRKTILRDMVFVTLYTIANLYSLLSVMKIHGAFHFRNKLRT